MELYDLGFLTKAVKTSILVLFLIILVVQLLITGNKIVRNAKILYLVFVLLGFCLNIFELLIIPKSHSLVLPTTNQYFGNNLTRFIFLILLGCFLVIIVFRLIFFRRGRTISGVRNELDSYGNTKKYGVDDQGKTAGFGVKLRVHSPLKTVNLPKTYPPTVDVHLMMISSIMLGAFSILRNLFGSLQRSSDVAWIIFEIVEVPLWVFLGVSMLLFKAKIREKKLIT